MENNIKRINALSDIEIKNKEQDAFEYQHYAEVLADFAEEEENMVVGVYGKWGTGKTSLLHLIEEKVKEKYGIEQDKNTNKKHITVWFNAWKYEKEPHPLVPLASQIISEFDDSRKFDAKSILKKAGIGILSFLKSLEVGVEAGPGKAKVDINSIIKYYIEHIEKNRLEQTIYELIFSMFKEIEDENEKSEEKTKITVFIDDLDRCLPQQALHLLESIKLIFEQKYITFYIALNKEVIEEFVKVKFKNDYGEGLININPDNYLEKLIQIAFEIPELKSDIRKLYDKLLENKELKEFKEQEDLNDLNFKSFVFDMIDYNPRRLKRIFYNSLINYKVFTKRKKAERKKIDDTEKIVKFEDVDLYFFLITKLFSISEINDKWSKLDKEDKNLNTNFFGELEKDEKKKKIFEKIINRKNVFNKFFSKDNSDKRDYALIFTENKAAYGGYAIITIMTDDLPIFKKDKKLENPEVTYILNKETKKLIKKEQLKEDTPIILDTDLLDELGKRNKIYIYLNKKIDNDYNEPEIILLNKINEKFNDKIIAIKSIEDDDVDFNIKFKFKDYTS